MKKKTIAEALGLPPREPGATTAWVPDPFSAPPLDAACASFLWSEELAPGGADPCWFPPDAHRVLGDGEAAFCVHGAITSGRGSRSYFANGKGGTAFSAVLADVPQQRRPRYLRLEQFMMSSPGRRREMLGLEAIWESLTIWQPDPAGLAKAYSAMWSVLSVLVSGEASRAEAAEALASECLSRWSQSESGQLVGLMVPGREPHEAALLAERVGVLVVPRRGGGASLESPGSRRGELARLAQEAGLHDAKEVAGGRALMCPGRWPGPEGLYVIACRALGAPVPDELADLPGSPPQWTRPAGGEWGR